MERIKKCTTICFFGENSERKYNRRVTAANRRCVDRRSIIRGDRNRRISNRRVFERRVREGSISDRKNIIGASTVSLNLATELALRNYRVLFGNSYESNEDFSFLHTDDNYKENKEEISFVPSKIERLSVLVFPKDASRMSPQKIEELLIELPETINKQGEFFIFNVNDPFNFPDRYILLHTDIHIIVARVKSAIFSDIFQQYEKLAFLPERPSKLFIVFSNTRDLDRAFEAYLELIKQTDELKLNIKFYFLGLLPDDLLRQNFSIQLKLPARIAFPDSSFKGAISFIADKIIRLSAAETGDEEQLLLEDSGNNC